MNLTDEMLPVVFWDQWGRAEPLTLDRESFTVEKRLCWPASLDLLLCLWGAGGVQSKPGELLAPAVA